MTGARDEDEAVRWAIRLDAEPLSDGEQKALDAWLSEDERRQGALLRAQAALAYLDRGRALAAAGPEVAASAPRFGRRLFLAGGALGGVAAAGLAGLLWLSPPLQQVATHVGEVRHVPLADGSLASLNTASRVSVAIGEERRRVRLEEGEAWFQVRRDPARPFVVEAGNVRVQAIGTAFSVRRRDQGAEVLVTEGVVETWIAGREARRTRIAAGARGYVAEAAAETIVRQAPESVDRALAWRSGEIALNGESLAYAVSEINRYNRRQLVIEDAALGREPLVGYFRTNDPENFGRAVAAMVGARMVEEGDTIRLMGGSS